MSELSLSAFLLVQLVLRQVHPQHQVVQHLHGVHAPFVLLLVSSRCCPRIDLRRKKSVRRLVDNEGSGRRACAKAASTACVARSPFRLALPASVKGPYTR